MDDDSNKPIVNVSGGISDMTGKARKAKKMNKSNFFLTINTQKGYPKHKREHLENDAEMVNELMQEMLNDLGSIVKFKDPTHTWSSQYIKSVNSNYACEVGEIYSKLHVHAAICVSHTSSIQLDRKKIEKLFEERLGITGIHIDIKILKSDVDNILEYINKKRFEPGFEDVV